MIFAVSALLSLFQTCDQRIWALQQYWTLEPLLFFARCLKIRSTAFFFFLIKCEEHDKHCQYIWAEWFSCFGFVLPSYSNHFYIRGQPLIFVEPKITLRLGWHFSSKHPCSPLVLVLQKRLNETINQLITLKVRLLDIQLTLIYWKLIAPQRKTQ